MTPIAYPNTSVKAFKRNAFSIGRSNQPLFRIESTKGNKYKRQVYQKETTTLDRFLGVMRWQVTFSKRRTEPRIFEWIVIWRHRVWRCRGNSPKLSFGVSKSPSDYRCQKSKRHGWAVWSVKKQPAIDNSENSYTRRQFIANTCKKILSVIVRKCIS